MIFYFTGTGNSLHAARAIAAAEGDGCVLSIPQEMKREGDLAYAADSIGIVYPVYGHLMPVMVRQFLERATFDTPYLYFVCTYGCRHGGAAELAARDAREAGHDPAYAAALLMVDNWLPGFDADAQRALIPEKRIDENLSRTAADIRARRRWIEPASDADRAAHAEFMSRGVAFEAAALKDFLRIDPDKCVGCGICSRVCPAGCIELADGIARRDAMAGMGCNACLACIHACPEGAIELPGGEVNPHARFRNEHVSLADIQRANNVR